MKLFDSLKIAKLLGRILKYLPGFLNYTDDFDEKYFLLVITTNVMPIPVS